MLQEFCRETVVVPCQVFTAGSDTVVRVEILIIWGEFCCVTENLFETVFWDVTCVCAAAVTALFELLLNA
jgi:hypothetical protein